MSASLEGSVSCDRVRDERGRTVGLGCERGVEEKGIGHFECVYTAFEEGIEELVLGLSVSVGRSVLICRVMVDVGVGVVVWIVWWIVVVLWEGGGGVGGETRAVNTTGVHD